MNKLIKVWCEWDIGLENTVFTDYDIAKKYATKGLSDSGVEGTFEELEEEGLIGFNTVYVISE